MAEGVVPGVEALLVVTVFCEAQPINATAALKNKIKVEVFFSRTISIFFHNISSVISVKTFSFYFLIIFI